ncbi:MAG TPA: hypothetical protein DDZ96_01860 [Porphyromonadaceae bacterium]|jgi:hypothetical protein|uniref:hypothetical protein n=1 Tax=Limibacterium fermenti TaxID=3229863 RepID=UPI000E7DCB57|nr:hypothetical protein [Porphyromonadaceae bacterium]HBL32551.1 hypothetical protein [Porphyromonadaceae bacterium]HBX20834.1 hypothetical protein [Porphyromonadaceae bacterium]HBX46433.1 hypothetical protein [Porphyromonadaceae bacterium]HCM20111.1 hypothetical protein [Porphyromonadaceae bacterium]
MNKRILSIVCAVFAASVALQAQQAVHWKSLKDVTWSRKYVAKMSGYYQMPSFGKNIERMDNKEITIEGFYMPIDVDGSIFALSETPSNACFFCGVGGVESVMEIMVKKGHKKLTRVRTDRYIQLKGIFKINRDDPFHLMYLLTDAELIKVIE